MAGVGSLQKPGLTLRRPLGWLRHRPAYAYLVIAILLASAGLGLFSRLYPRASTAGPETEAAGPTRQPLAAYTENGVTVDIALAEDGAGQRWLVGTFRPLREHFHLYSKDWPKEGVRGQGRPTLMEIVSPGRVTPVGVLLADQPTADHYNYAIQQSLPVYPDGPVTLRLHIALAPGDPSVPTVLALTYMTCSDDSCLTPVVDQPLSVYIP
jgi:hypothetical protein